MTRGLLLFAHGARDSRWALPFEAVLERVHALAPDVPARLAFLEFMTPTLAEAGHALAAAGCTRVEVVPLFLGAGGHVQRDLPRLLAELERAHPAVHWQAHPAIGEIDSVVDAMAAASLAWLQRDP